MGYNYKSAFTEAPYTKLELQQIAVAALMQYKADWEDDDVIEVDVMNKVSAVKVTGAQQVLLYTFKELGFASHP